VAPTHDERVADHSGNYADYDQALDYIVRRIAPATGERGLDIGTGTGNLAAGFIERGASMSGVDQSKEMLRLCQKKLPALETRIGNFLALPYVAEQFDFVVSSFAFHHLGPEQQLLALEEIRRVSKPRGRVCIADLMAEAEPETGRRESDFDYPPVQAIVRWFANNGYRTEVHRMNELLHIIYAYGEEKNDAGS
jgi:putative AdoMet-dependent methyltransferase